MALLSCSGKIVTVNGKPLLSIPIAPVGFTDPDNWTRYASNPVVPVGGGGAWDANWIQPDTLLLNGSDYWMYYSGAPSGGESGVPNKIGYATSSNGLSWTKYGGNPILSPGSSGAWDDIAVNHMIVIKEGANWKAWYAGRGADGSPSPWKIGYATSSNGTSWTKYGSNPVLDVTGGAWDAGFVVPSCIRKVGSTYYLYYWGGGDDMSTWKAGLATSADGISWTKYASNPIFEGDTGEWDDGILEPFVFKIGPTYYMIYQGNTTDGQNSALGFATSSDGISWTREATNPFPRGANGTWDDKWGEAPKIIKIGDTWMLYYMGQPGGGPMQIGLMTLDGS